MCLVLSAGVASTAVGSAGVLSAVVMVVVRTANIGIILQLTGKKCFHSGIRIPSDAAKQPDAGLGKSHLGTTADAAANQRVHAQLGQQPSQGAVTTAVGIDDLCGYDAIILNFIDFELCRVPKVLKNSSAGIGYCDFHNDSPLYSDNTIILLGLRMSNKSF